MSFYIGDAAVHNVPLSFLAQEEAELQAEVRALRRAFGQLAREILILLINAILRAMGLGEFIGPLDSAINAVENALLDIPKGNVTGLVDSLATISLDIAQIIEEIVQALEAAGVSTLTEFIHELRGLLPAAIPQFNGTALAAAVPGFTALGNGTASYTPQVGVGAGDAVSNLIQQADGTVVTAAHAVQQAAQAAASVSAANIGTAVAAGQQVVDHAIAALTGNLNLGQAAQTFGFHLGRHFTGVFNAKTGASQPSAVSADVIAAEQAAAAAAAALAQQTAAINAQLPHFYGGSGASGNNFSVPLTAYTPAGFTLTNGIELYTAGVTLTDQQTVSAIWDNVLNDGETRGVQLRSNIGATTYVEATISLTGIGGYQSTAYDYSKGILYFVNPTDPNRVFTFNISCYVAGVQTSFQTWSYDYWAYGFSSGGRNYYQLGAGYYYEIASANHVFAFEATANVFTISFRQDTWTYTDSSNVSQVGSSYRSGAYSDTIVDPSTQIAWDFYDSGPTAGPGTAYVATGESTSSVFYGDLATTTDQITVNVGGSGMVLVSLSAEIHNTVAVGSCLMSFVVSGANTGAADDSFAISIQNYPGSVGASFLLTGLAAGATTFKAKYRAGAGTGTFYYRRITAIPL